MKALAVVSGANGFLGRAVCAALAPRWRVRGLVREAAQASASAWDEAGIVGNLEDAQEWDDLVAGADIVIHLAARVHVAREVTPDPLERYRRANAGATAALARAAARAGVRLFVFMSTAAVYGSGPFQKPLTEDDPVHPETPYARSKAEAEEELAGIAARTGLPVVVLRPPMVYGPEAPGNFFRLVRLIQGGVPLPFGRIDNQRSLLYIGNLVSVILSVLDDSRAVGRTFLVADAEALSTSALIERIASVLGMPARLFPVPSSLLWCLGHATGRSREVRQLTQSMVLSTARADRELGWSAPCPLDKALALSLASSVSSRCRSRSG